ncbi:hypothetical protein Clacol_004216 [Clathrus columnatus]|uniref:Uncharacterized protein n=1 Tax=Clathrus columnatus TaxID=1419009 RepID=A0AAV5A6T1_9AGAM|nr:hypothetical protein Clacol_004216 [Clathrus columnatus]
MPDYILSLNAFSEVIVHGLLLKDEASIPLTFHRGVSREGELCEIPFGPDAVCRGIPPRPPSNLPPPGGEHLSIMLGETLGSGRVGTVHRAILLGHDYDTKLPPLVIKVSRQKLSESIEQEAWFYEELEHVQGIAVPLCYGFFQARIEDGTEVTTWNDDKSYIKHKRQGDPTLLSILLLERLGERIPMHQSDYSIIQ